ncbi:MAG: hypothetical protein ACTSP6_11540 [Promethearchaeota archaeon]
MVNVDNIDRNFRNLGLVLLLIAIVILTFWMVYYLTLPNKTNIIWAYIGIALLLGGILLVTRIQFVIWMEKRARVLAYCFNSRF